MGFWFWGLISVVKGYVISGSIIEFWNIFYNYSFVWVVVYNMVGLVYWVESDGFGDGGMLMCLVGFCVRGVIVF